MRPWGRGPRGGVDETTDLGVTIRRMEAKVRSARKDLGLGPGAINNMDEERGKPPEENGGPSDAGRYSSHLSSGQRVSSGRQRGSSGRQRVSSGRQRGSSGRRIPPAFEPLEPSTRRPSNLGNAPSAGLLPKI